ncbi:hypothetical protein [Streptomyces sp. SID12488]|uniref:hypothetical protein n=1 Tax=Streptomyces sp. SID12488 TaxID=2706040 RepID=UPI0013DB885B|nr:hypothetical protein [Streptomyces sp. SID12488]NEA62483.1 hypothetical protein [Streptomyces sp. SID12488]
MPDMSASASLAMTHLLPFAAEVDEDKVTPGVLGFIVFAVMALAVWALMKSMNKQMGRIEFKEAPDPEQTPAATKETASGAANGAARGSAKGSAQD